MTDEDVECWCDGGGDYNSGAGAGADDDGGGAGVDDCE